MKTLIISRPIYDYILPLVEFPQDGDTFYIDNATRTVTNTGSLIAITLAKFGVDVSYTGMIGDDEVGRKIKELFESYNIDTKYIETSYTEKTCSNYKIYNQKTNKFTTIYEKTIKTGLAKYKYEFIPDVVVMDDGDYNANLAAMNNYPNSNLIYIGDKFSKDSQVYCNKCKYLITSLSFASQATGVTNNLNKPKNMVQLFQKFIDLYNSNLIIKLDNFDILYCVNDEVRIIKNVNKNVSNKDDLFKAIFIFFLINFNDVEASIKYTNKVMQEVGNDLDMINNIPDSKTVRDIIEKSNISDLKMQNEVVSDEKEETISLESEATENLEELNVNKEISNHEEPIETPKLDTTLNNVEGDNEIEKL